MKKIIFLLMLLMSITIFAEKLTTDGKNNLDKLQGSWGSETYEIRKNKQWTIGIYESGDGEMKWYKPQVYKDIFIIQNYYQMPNKKDKNLYLAYDTKYKVLVILDKDLNIIEKIPRKYSNSIN